MEINTIATNKKEEEESSSSKYKSPFCCTMINWKGGEQYKYKERISIGSVSSCTFIYWNHIRIQLGLLLLLLLQYE